MIIVTSNRSNVLTPKNVAKHLMNIEPGGETILVVLEMLIHLRMFGQQLLRHVHRKQWHPLLDATDCRLQDRAEAIAVVTLKGGGTP